MLPANFVNGHSHARSRIWLISGAFRARGKPCASWAGEWSTGTTEKSRSTHKFQPPCRPIRDRADLCATHSVASPRIATTGTPGRCWRRNAWSSCALDCARPLCSSPSRATCSLEGPTRSIVPQADRPFLPRCPALRAGFVLPLGHGERDDRSGSTGDTSQPGGLAGRDARAGRDSTRSVHVHGCPGGGCSDQGNLPVPRRRSRRRAASSQPGPGHRCPYRPVCHSRRRWIASARIGRGVGVTRHCERLGVAVAVGGRGRAADRTFVAHVGAVGRRGAQMGASGRRMAAAPR